VSGAGEGEAGRSGLSGLAPRGRGVGVFFPVLGSAPPVENVPQAWDLQPHQGVPLPVSWDALARATRARDGSQPVLAAW
jgi:hypothetical protein